MLKVAEVSKRFGNFQVLTNISFDVKNGEKVGIIGPNGAGKTTLFNIISGFLKPDSGEIIYKEVRITAKKPSWIAKIGIVRTFQIIKLFENLTVAQNIEAAGGDVEILKEMNLWAKRNEIAKNLSQGEMRRLSIAMALCLDPKILLLDEPFSGLDFQDSAQLAQTIQSLDGKMAMIIIEHRLAELFGVAERVLVLNAGKIIFDGLPEDVFESREVREAYLGRKYANSLCK
ncbi:MAG: ABC transporter ATP-binding protein [Archaeoglobales archaeon]|nr:ABC transporter ATP-binding protein [Archaeoglobales archaeon]